MSTVYSATIGEVTVTAENPKALARLVKKEEERQAKEAAIQEENQERANEVAWSHYGMIADRMFGTGAKPWFIDPTIKTIDAYTKGILVEHSRYGNGDCKIGTEYECVAAIMNVAGDTLAIRVTDPHMFAGRSTNWHAVGSFDGACQAHMLSSEIADQLESLYQEHLAREAA